MSDIETTLKKLFTKEQVIRYLKEASPLYTTVMDTVFPKRPNHPLPRVSSHYVMDTVKALPLIQRGGTSMPVSSYSGKIETYEPLSVRPSYNITGLEIHDLKMLGDIGLTQWAADRTAFLAACVRASCEALASQSITGTIDYPVKLDGGGWESFGVAWGSPQSVTTATKWDAVGATPAAVYQTLSNMRKALMTYGYGNQVVIWVADNVYGVLLTMAGGQGNMNVFNLLPDATGININGFKILPMTEFWTNPRTGATVNKIEDDHCVMIALDGGQQMPYCAVDDLDFNLQAAPFAVKPVKKPDASSITLIAEAKPFPMPNMKGIVESDVLT